MRKLKLRAILGSEGLLSEEGHNGGNYMSVLALKKLIEGSGYLQTQITSGTPLEDWIEAKLTSASNDIQDVADFFKNRGAWDIAGSKVAADGQPDPKKRYDLYVAHGQGEDEVLKKDLKLSDAVKAMKTVDSVLAAADELNEEEHGAKLKKLQGRLDRSAFGVNLNLGEELFLVLKDPENKGVSWHWTGNEWELD